MPSDGLSAVWTAGATVEPDHCAAAAMPPGGILIADDHPLICAALAQMLRDTMPGGAVLTAGSLDRLETLLDEHPDLDLALLDLHMPGAQGFSSLLWLRAHRPALPVILISSNDHPRTICRAQQFGAAGFLSKSVPVHDMVCAIRTVIRGGSCFPEHRVQRSSEDAQLGTRLAQLTPQQMRVLMCLAGGLLNKQIAHELRLAENTVKVHVTAVLHKLGCRSRTHAAVLARTLEAEGAPLAMFA
jgi:DNA-binding NarL/FixJ family response regulator